LFNANIKVHSTQTTTKINEQQSLLETQVNQSKSDSDRE